MNKKLSSTKHKKHHHTLDALTSQNVTIVFVLNFFFAILEFIFGFLFNSTAILSDAVHDTGDAVAIGLAWFFQKFSKRGEDNKFSFGYQRFSLLGAILTSVILITGSFVVLFESVPRLLNPQPVQASGMFGLAIFAIVANGFGAWLLARGSSRNESILNLHALEDVLGWLGVLIVSITLHFVDWYWLDPLLSIAIALFILSKALPKFVGTLRILLESVPLDVDYSDLLLELEKLPEVRAITQLIIWSIDGEQNAAMIHILIPQNQDFTEAKVAVRKLLEAHHVCQSAIELDETQIEHECHLKYEK
ncbi:cation diffusion facilitator family transporter [Lactococcus protaetiae]|uniref:Cation transporter n=1 Tax=Lactococcus protaetiae TaxID=2592653 RepID=A0A514ZAJ2_9LACT|nr:cation diffusion facilitator family transporter [Lactococcus protaetiae]MCL2112538.1 cation diffusion facilitator family transporter [Streptococcaceae bacterium]QDK71600.1 cation transporter [Lactococcus protaetiae]